MFFIESFFGYSSHGFVISTFLNLFFFKSSFLNTFFATSSRDFGTLQKGVRSRPSNETLFVLWRGRSQAVPFLRLRRVGNVLLTSFIYVKSSETLSVEIFYVNYYYLMYFGRILFRCWKTLSNKMKKKIA